MSGITIAEQEAIIETHNRLLDHYDTRIAKKGRLFEEANIRGFVDTCYSELEKIGCVAIVYEREQITRDNVMIDEPSMRIVSPPDHRASGHVDNPSYQQYKDLTATLFAGQGALFRLRKITNPGKSSALVIQNGMQIETSITGAYCMPFWIKKKGTIPDIIPLFLEKHYAKNADVHCISFEPDALKERILTDRMRFQDLLFELYMPSPPRGKPDIFYYPSYHKGNLESHMIFAFDDIEPKAYPGIERLCSRIAYLFRKATADDMAYRLNAASIAARTMCRNFAHNFGSHGLLYVSLDSHAVVNYQPRLNAATTDLIQLMTTLQTGATLTNAELIRILDKGINAVGEEFARQCSYYKDLIDIVDYVRDRATYQAQVSNAASFWTLNYDLSKQIKISDIQLLKKNLCRSELGADSLEVRVINKSRSQTPIAAVSMGGTGIQAIYSIIENIAKNTAKYGKRKNNRRKIKVSMFIEDDANFKNDYRIAIETNFKQDMDDVSELVKYFDEITFDNVGNEYERLGLSDILISVGFLRRLKPYMITKYMKRSDDDDELQGKPPLLEISLSDRVGETNNSIRYTFYLPKPNNVLIISNESKVQDLVDSSSEIIAVRKKDRLVELVAGSQQRIPRHEFLIIDRKLKDEMVTDHQDGKTKPFKQWLYEHLAYLPSRLITASADEIVSLFAEPERQPANDAASVTPSRRKSATTRKVIDVNRFMLRVWSMYASHRSWSPNAYIIDQKLRGRNELTLELPISVRMKKSRACQVTIGHRPKVVDGSVIFLHDYETDRKLYANDDPKRYVTERPDRGLSSGATNRRGARVRGAKFLEAINQSSWTAPFYDFTNPDKTRDQFADNDFLALYRFIEAANASVFILDERVDRELSRQVIVSKNMHEPFDKYWSQRNVFRVSHKEFVAGGGDFLAETHRRYALKNRPAFFFIHLTLLQQLIREKGEEYEQAFGRFALRWSKVGIKIIVHSDRGNHDLARKWKASIATFDALGDALQSGDKLALVNLAFAARAPSLERN